MHAQPLSRRSPPCTPAAGLPAATACKARFSLQPLPRRPSTRNHAPAESGRTSPCGPRSRRAGQQGCRQRGAEPRKHRRASPLSSSSPPLLSLGLGFGRPSSRDGGVWASRCLCRATCTHTWHGCPHRSGQVTGETGLGQHLPPDFQLPYWCGVLAKLLSGCSLIFILFCLVCCRFFPPGKKIFLKFCFPPTPH